MKILAFDSTAKAASVAVTEDDKLLALYTIDNGLTQSELLLPMAENILKSLKLDFSDIELFAVAVGPGSFTGVRIGAALVKGLAFGRDIPCAEVSTIEALAENARGLVGLVVPCMDARRGQVYTAIFNGGERLMPDSAISIEELGEALKPYEGREIYLVGDGYNGTYKKLSEMGIALADTPTLLLIENAYSVAVVAYKKHLHGETVSDRELSPTYLRMPQAERERLERLEKTN